MFKKVSEEAKEAEEADDESAPAEDLFSEIHLGQLKKLEKQLESSETEKMSLSLNVREIQDNLETARKEALAQKAKVSELLAFVGELTKLNNADAAKLILSKESGDLKNSSDLLQKHKDWNAKALDEIKSLQEHIKIFSVEDYHTFDTVSKLRNDLNGLRSEITSNEKTMGDLNHDIKIMDSLSVEAQKVLGLCQNELYNVTEELAKIYHHICTANNITPSRVMLEHSKGGQKINIVAFNKFDANTFSGSDPRQTEQKGESFSPSPSKMDVLRSKLRTVQHLADSSQFGDSSTVATNLDTIKDQLKYLKSAIESSLEMSKKKMSSSVTAETPGNLSPVSEGELVEAQEQLVKLKSLLSTKREQIATLRTVLKANKQTAEVALANLKSKYDTEKTIVSDTMVKLRNELRLLKEDAATFSSLRAMFAARCEEYSTQVDELQVNFSYFSSIIASFDNSFQRSLGGAEDEKKTLNQLLRMAIHQKLVLTQRLEDIEMSEMRPSHVCSVENCWPRSNDFFLFFREVREGVRGKPPVTAEAIAEDPDITGDSRGARDETIRGKDGKIKLWVYKLHFTKQGLYSLFSHSKIYMKLSTVKTRKRIE